jgi:hypothetical protein
MKQKTYLMPVAGLFLVALSLLSACTAPQPAGLTNEGVAAVTENALQALNDGDYTRFVRDFSDPMKTAFSEDQFVQLHDLLQSTSGKFLSVGKLYLSNDQTQGFAVYRIPCQFELEEVVVTITFRIGGDQVEGLYFTSPNLRASS